MNILITGGAGYLGSVLVPALLASGQYRVTVLDNFLYRQIPFNHLCMDPGFTVVRGDARDARTVKPLLNKADAVIPLAAIVGAPACALDEHGAMSTNWGAIDLLTDMMAPEQRMLLPVTNSGYGIGEPGVSCTEDSPLRPISIYARSKMQAEETALARGQCISFRFATLFGMSPRMRLDLLVNDFVYRAVTDGAVTLFEAHFKRNYLHVRDAAAAFMYGLAHWQEMQGSPFNVGLSDANLSKRELCERIKLRVPGFTALEAEIGEDPDKRDYVVSNERIERAGFKPMRTLDDGITELIKGYAMIRNQVHGNG